MVLKTSERTFDILEYLRSNGSSTIDEVAEKMDMKPSTTDNHLRTLRQKGYVTKNTQGYQIGRKIFDLHGGVGQTEIIDTLAQKNGCSPRELVAELDGDEEWIQRQLAALLENGYIAESDGKYICSLKFLDIGGHRRSQMRVYCTAKPYIDKLAEDTGELVNLMVEEQGVGVYLYQSSGELALELDTYSGFRCHLHTTALGKAILAYLPKQRVGEIIDHHGLPAMTSTTITDSAELREELNRVRDRGYATDDGERLEGLRCIAAPIRTEDGAVQGSISVAGPQSRLQGTRLKEEIPNSIANIINVVELNMNYS